MADLVGGKFQPMQYQRALPVLTVMLCCLGAAAAQIIEFRADGVKCRHSGLSSHLEHCDVPDWYACAFVGSISAINPIENGESEIQVTPDEVFSRRPWELIDCANVAGRVPAEAGSRGLLAFLLAEVRPKPSAAVTLTAKRRRRLLRLPA